MTINGHTFDAKGRHIDTCVEDWMIEELHVVFTDGSYLDTHGDSVIEGTLDDRAPHA